MAHFRATIKGSRGKASRLGTEHSGIQAVVNGWFAGVEVDTCIVFDGSDTFEIYMTYGSSDECGHFYIGRVVATDGGPRFDPAAVSPPQYLENIGDQRHQG